MGRRGCGCHPSEGSSVRRAQHHQSNLWHVGCRQRWCLSITLRRHSNDSICYNDSWCYKVNLYKLQMCGILVAILSKNSQTPFHPDPIKSDESESESKESQESEEPTPVQPEAETKTDNTNTRFLNALQKTKQRGPDYTTTVFSKYTAFGQNHLYTGTVPGMKTQWTYVIDGYIDTDLGLLLDKHGVDAAHHCNGTFAFVAYHPVVGLVASRDIMGISPLYIGVISTLYGHETWFASELKGLQHCDWYRSFPIGTVYNGVRYSLLSQPDVKHASLFNLLRSAVEQQLRIEVPWGIILSGGIHSGIIASLTRFCDRPKGYPVLHTFTIGIQGSPNLAAARSIAKELQSVHHEVLFTPTEGIQEITNVIAAIESYDTTLVQMSIPLYMLARHIRQCGVKVVLSGLGAEESFTFSNQLYTGCIVNKCMAAHGIACRVPFMDTSVVHLVDKHISRTNILTFFKDCVPKGVVHPHNKNKKWIQACEAYGIHRYELIYNTLYPNLI